MSDAEQRAQRKKRARRDFDDEDYEEPAQARKGVLRSQPSDKRKAGQKGIQRIDSMQFGGVRPPSMFSLSFFATQSVYGPQLGF